MKHLLVSQTFGKNY